MSGLDNLNTRLNYMGGGRQESRMQDGKLRALKKALLYSYQAATAVINGKEFRCLMNPDKLKEDYDIKILSIPFKDVCLNEEQVGTTTQGQVNIEIKVGDIFTWKETNTDWLVCLRHIEEDAYFRAEVRKCNYEVELNGIKYRVYARGPIEKDTTWKKGNLEMYNELNYTLAMYITKNEETMDYFERFKKIKLNGKPWEVQAVDKMSSDGIIEVYLKETFSNTLEEEMAEANIQIDESQEAGLPHISGPAVVYPYDTHTYIIEELSNGIWTIDNLKVAKIIKQTSDSVEIFIITGRSGEFILNYSNGTNSIDLPIVIESL